MNQQATRRVRRFLKDNNKSQNSLARDLGISPAYMSQILSGVRGLSLELAVKLEHITGIPTNDFAEVA